MAILGPRRRKNHQLSESLIAASRSLGQLLQGPPQSLKVRAKGPTNVVRPCGQSYLQGHHAMIQINNVPRNRMVTQARQGGPSGIELWSLFRFLRRCAMRIAAQIAMARAIHNQANMVAPIIVAMLANAAALIIRPPKVGGWRGCCVRGL